MSKSKGQTFIWDQMTVPEESVTKELAQIEGEDEPGKRPGSMGNAWQPRARAGAELEDR